MAKEIDDDIADLVGTPKSAQVGDNSGNTETQATTSAASGQLLALVERIENLEEEKRAVADQVKEVYAEAKGGGFDGKTIRKIIARRKRDAEELAEEDALLDLYMAALGMLPA